MPHRAPGRIAVSVRVPVAITRNRPRLDVGLHTILQIMSLTAWKNSN